jgi:hypothetical protein
VYFVKWFGEFFSPFRVFFFLLQILYFLQHFVLYNNERTDSRTASAVRGPSPKPFTVDPVEGSTAEPKASLSCFYYTQNQKGVFQNGAKKQKGLHCLQNIHTFSFKGG